MQAFLLQCLSLLRRGLKTVVILKEKEEPARTAVRCVRFFTQGYSIAGQSVHEVPLGDRILVVNLDIKRTTQRQGTGVYINCQSGHNKYRVLVVSVDVISCQ